MNQKNSNAQCHAAGVPFFMKQLWQGGALIKDCAQFPADLQIQQFPESAR